MFGLDRIEWDQGGVGDSLGQGDLVARSLVEGYADHHAMADDEGGELAKFYVGEGGRDALALLGEGLAAGEGEVGAAVDEAGEAVGVFGVDVCEQAVGPVAGVGLHKARVLARGQADALGDDVGGFARTQERRAPQRREGVGACALGQVTGLLAPGVIERDRKMPLEAALQVVGGLAVAGQIDARGCQLAGVSAAGSAGATSRLPRYRNEYSPAAIVAPSSGPAYQTQPLAQ